MQDEPVDTAEDRGIVQLVNPFPTSPLDSTQDLNELILLQSSSQSLLPPLTSFLLLLKGFQLSYPPSTASPHLSPVPECREWLGSVSLFPVLLCFPVSPHTKAPFHPGV